MINRSVNRLFIGLPILINWKKDSYISILVIVDKLTKMVYYKPRKISIDALKLVRVIIDVLVWHYGLAYLIMTNKDSFFTLKFYLLLYYFFGIKEKLLTAFHL